MALLDDRRQLDLTGDRENDIADAHRWFIDRGAGDLDQQALLSIDPLDVFRDIAHHLAFRACSDLVNGFDQQVDHRVCALRLARHYITRIKAEHSRRRMPSSEERVLGREGVSAWRYRVART